MSVGDIFYILLIEPLELLFEIIFSQANGLLHSPGLAIVFLSLAMNFLLLPLYRRTDAIQEEAGNMEKKLKPFVDHIKKAFTGDERYMMLQTLYRQNHYKPWDVLKGTTSLLLEIPFFMAAYHFLSNLQLLQGLAFGPIGDLGSPDGMLTLGGFSVNLLPILMTLINIVSSRLYTRDLPKKTQLQLYLMAGLFLVVLYDSPAGLVFYWTLNNLFSLIKNIFCSLKNPKKVFAYLCSGIGILGISWLILCRPLSSRRSLAMCGAMMLALQLPLILELTGSRRKPIEKAEKQDGRLFLYGCIFLTVLTGLLIPTGVMVLSPEEFVHPATVTNPLMYILSAFLMAAGTFLVWFSVFYLISNPRARKIMAVGIFAVSGAAVINFLFFGRDYGMLSSSLKYDVFPSFRARDQLINLAALAILGAGLILLYRKKRDTVKVLYIAAGFAAVCMSFYQIYNIHQDLFRDGKTLEAPVYEEADIPLSRDGKNVVVLMMDRALNSYFPFLLQEKPELREQFAGFTYYPNTISYGQCTIIGVPALLGGYEYTPENMNLRQDQLLVDKHNEALKVMPVMFLKEGYDVTVMDPSLAGYHFVPDLHVYDDYPEIRAFNAEESYNPTVINAGKNSDSSMYRNFFCYSLFKTAPTVLQPVLYGKSSYNETDVMFATGENAVFTDQYQENMHRSRSIDPHSYSFFQELEHLPEMTRVQSGEDNTFLFLSNCAAHDTVLLKVPEYEHAPEVDNTEYDLAHMDRFILGDTTMKMENTLQMMSYHINMGAMLRLGQWFDHLRELGVYDNTRIIIAADHGQTLRQFPNMEDPDGEDMMSFHPLLLVKDFGSTELTMDQSFMTNADVPMLAAQGLIAEPVNPMTGNPLSDAEKHRKPQHLYASMASNPGDHPGSRFEGGRWIALNGDLFDTGNWTYIEDPTLP